MCDFVQLTQPAERAGCHLPCEHDCGCRQIDLPVHNQCVRRRAGFLLYAAIQFVVLTTLAMQVYAGGTMWDPWSRGYAFTGNFLSELGATSSWSGQENHASAVLFAIALGTLGIAFILFAGAWRGFAFGRKRGAAVGVAGQVFGTASGLGFAAVAVTPVNLALQAHNIFVVAAFGMLLGYAACTTIVWAKNGGTRLQISICTLYVVLVLVYFVVVAIALKHGVVSERGHRELVVSQKAMAYASMLYIGYVTVAVRRIIPA